MALTNTAITPVKPGNVQGATALNWTLTKRVRKVRVRNSHATQTLVVRVATGTSPAAATAAADAAQTAAGISATSDNTFNVPPAGGVVDVFNSSRSTFVCITAKASGAATPVDIEGSDPPFSVS